MLPLHDLHHVATGFRSGLIGEAEISDEEIRRRMSAWKPPRPRYPTGVFAKYAALVLSASEGAITKPQL